MEHQLEGHPFITGDKYNIADIALYAYTHVADEGGFDLADYAAIRGWMERIAQRPKFVPMQER